jgi:hypothetical protein
MRTLTDSRREVTDGVPPATTGVARGCRSKASRGPNRGLVRTMSTWPRQTCKPQLPAAIRQSRPSKSVSVSEKGYLLRAGEGGTSWLVGRWEEPYPLARRFRPWHGGCRTRASGMRAQRGLRAPLAHVLLGRLDAPTTSTEHTTCPFPRRGLPRVVRRSSSGRPLRHLGRLADAAQVPSDAFRFRDKREHFILRCSAVSAEKAECERLSDRVHFDTKPGNGTTFRFSMPAPPKAKT